MQQFPLELCQGDLCEWIDSFVASSSPKVIARGQTLSSAPAIVQPPGALHNSRSGSRAGHARLSLKRMHVNKCAKTMFSTTSPLPTHIDTVRILSNSEMHPPNTLVLISLSLQWQYAVFIIN